MDSDNIVATKSDTDFVSMTSKAIFGINYKMVLLLFIIYILLHNDIFILTDFRKLITLRLFCFQNPC